MNAILVPLDGSPEAERALAVAAALAARAKSTLHLVHVARAAAGDPARRREEDYLKAVAARDHGVPATARVLEGPSVAGAIDRYAEEAGVELVVMTTHGRGPLSQLWLGSTADEVARHAPVPVLLVRGGVNVTLPHKVLVCLDGSPAAERAVAPAARLATMVGGELHLLRVVVPPTAADVGPDGFVPTLADIHLTDHLRAEAEAYVARQADAVRPSGLAVHARVGVHPHAPTAILDDAKDHGCDAIALTARARGVLSRLVLGSVADKVVRAAGGLVLVCPPHG